MAKNKLVAPVVKWVGGKRQLLDEITPLLPKRITSYCEPFLGGGAVLFSIQPSKAIVNDLNGDLIAVYEIIRDDVESLIAELKKHENTSEYFYAIRDLDRDKATYQAMSKVERASRLIYLNKTCFNGLFRVNQWHFTRCICFPKSRRYLRSASATLLRLFAPRLFRHWQFSVMLSGKN